MASTIQGRQLTEQNRRHQVALRSRFLARFVTLWPLLDWARIDETTPGWVQAVMGLVRPFRQESADLAVSYYREFRQAEAPATPIPVPEVEFLPPAPRPLTSNRLLEELERRRRLGDAAARRVPPEASREPVQRGERLVKPRIDWSGWDKAAERSLLITGPGELKRQSRLGRDERRAKDAGLVTSSGAASRHVLAGGRETALTLVRADDRALGYIRVTDSDPCAFCAMLASRGPTFKRRSFSEVNRRTGRAFVSDPRFEGLSRNEAKVHDGCACTLEPVYSGSAAWPGRAGEFRALWDANIAGKYSGKDALNAWRRLLDAQRREQGLPRPLTA